MTWVAVGVGLGVVAAVGLVVAAARRSGAGAPTEELDPLFVPGIGTVAVGAALLSPMGPFAFVMIGFGIVLLVIALTRMRRDGSRRT